MTDEQPHFNLWYEPWLAVERPSGALESLNLEQTLTQAPAIHAVYDPSPLVVTSVHRLLVAVLQAIIAPQEMDDLAAVWRAGKFPAERIAAFGHRYAHRFDVFSEQAPFLQSADLKISPEKGDKVKPVGYLLPEQPSGSAVTHYKHLYDDAQIFCAACAAKGLLAIPPFATSGGAGIKPSINGVPPVYILPGGETLFQSLTASLTIPKYQPEVASSDDLPWWERETPVVVGHKQEVSRVGYLHSLTFPARRVRLHPVVMNAACSRCGKRTSWGVRTMIYEMGESRPKDASFWKDPFAAYRINPEGKKPTPIRPIEGRALWRDFAAFFLPAPDESLSDQEKKTSVTYQRPAILGQLDDLSEMHGVSLLPFGAAIPLRAIGMRTDMKMKIFEWEETGFSVPPRLLRDSRAGGTIRAGLNFVSDLNKRAQSIFAKRFKGNTKSQRYRSLQRDMQRVYWQRLGLAFRQHIAAFNDNADLEVWLKGWTQAALNIALDVFTTTVEALPSDGNTLHQQQDAINTFLAAAYQLRKETLPEQEAD